MAVSRRAALLGASSLLLGGWRAGPGIAPAADPYPLGQHFTSNDLAPTTSIPNYNNGTAGRVAIGPGLVGGQTTACVMIIGDSVSALSSPAVYTVTQSLNHNLNPIDGGIYQTKDPILGPSGGWGNGVSGVAAPLGDNLITAGVGIQRAIMLPGGVGSTTVADWAPGGFLNQNIGTMARRMAVAGIPLNAVIWLAGPNDNIGGTSQTAYAASLAAMIGTIRTYWPSVSVPILICVCSKASGVNSAAVENAQIGAVNHAAGIWAGVNSDAYAADHFQDGTHFSTIGRDAWAADIVPLLHATGSPF